MHYIFLHSAFQTSKISKSHYVFHINPFHYLQNSSETGPSVGPLPRTPISYHTAFNNLCINIEVTLKLKNKFKAEISNGVCVKFFKNKMNAYC